MYYMNYMYIHIIIYMQNTIYVHTSMLKNEYCYLDALVIKNQGTGMVGFTMGVTCLLINSLNPLLVEVTIILFGASGILYSRGSIDGFSMK